MLSKYDEFLCHQTVDHFDEVSTSDRNWTEKTWGAAYDHSGKIMIDWGFGKYTNRNVMDGFAIVALEGNRQYSVRVSRELRPNMDDIKIGPLSYEVVEPLKKIHIRLGENDQGISFDLLFEGTFPISEEPPSFQKRKGTVVHNSRRYYQYGTVTGQVTAEGKTYDVKKGEWSACRDHSWGIRPGVGLPPKGSSWSLVEGLDDQGLEPRSPNLLPVIIEFAGAQFKDQAFHYWLIKTEDGQLLRTMASDIGRPFGHPDLDDPRKRVVITHVEHETEYRTDNNRPKSARAVIHTSDGGKKDLEIKLLSFCFAGAGGYFGFKEWNFGRWMGPYAIAGEKLNLTDEKEMEGLVNRYDDYACEIRCGDEVGFGIYNIANALRVDTSLE